MGRGGKMEIKIRFNRKNFFDEAEVSFIKEKIKELSGEIYFQFFPDNLVLGFLNFRYGGNLRNQQAKKGVNRKVILDKWLAKKLKKERFYVLRNIELFFFNKYIIFISGEIKDLTDQIQSSEIEIERSNQRGLVARKKIKFRHPLQDDGYEGIYYPDPQFEWSQEDVAWAEWRAQAMEKYNKETQEIKKEFLYCDKEKFFYCKLISMEAIEEKIVSVDMQKSTVTVKPVLKIKFLKKSFSFGEEPKEEVIEEIAKDGLFFGRIGFQAVVNAQKTREISISLEKIDETVSEDTKEERVHYTRNAGGNDGFRKGLQVSGTETVFYKIKKVKYLVKGIPETCTRNRLAGETLFRNYGYGYNSETKLMYLDNKGKIILVHEVTIPV